MLHEAHNRIAEINAELETHLDFAFNQRWGFLTACPTNVGCGVRFSVMLHLPGLRITDELERVRRAARDLNLAVRGFQGEGTESTGDFFQISNQVTLGLSEQDLLATFADDIVPRLVDYERSARQLLLEKRIRTLEDRVHRAHGILSSARMLEANEAINLLSRVRLGVALGLLKAPSVRDVHRLLLHVQPAHVSSMTDAPLEDNEASRVARAQMVRNAFNEE
jgi:protein arginine kinase